MPSVEPGSVACGTASAVAPVARAGAQQGLAGSLTRELGSRFGLLVFTPLLGGSPRDQLEDHALDPTGERERRLVVLRDARQTVAPDVEPGR